MYFGTVETWLLWSLTGGPQGGLFLSDVTNASRTMFMSYVYSSKIRFFKAILTKFVLSLKTLDWDPTILKFFGVRPSCLAKIVSNSEVYGNIATTVLAGTSISGMIGDQQAALVGQKCLAVSYFLTDMSTYCS